MPEIPRGESAVRAALREIVAEHGHGALSSSVTMSNLVKDLLPDDQDVGRILVVAAEQKIADALQDHVSQGMDVNTACRLVASSFAAKTMFAAEPVHVGRRGAGCRAWADLDRRTSGRPGPAGGRLAGRAGRADADSGYRRAAAALGGRRATRPSGRLAGFGRAASRPARCCYSWAPR